MGKTNKKINSEKVNALRKQYDAYIEDEKKRKQRNDYILEKLDKIRSCNVLVPLRHDTINRPHNLSTPQAVLEYTIYSPLSEQQHLTKPYSCVDENIMKEISKNFILIPKNKNKLFNEVIEAPNENDNKTDWKSKYDILNQLKQSEKESVEKDDSPSLKVESKDFGLVTDESRMRETKICNKITNNNLEKPEKDLNNEWLVNPTLPSSEPHIICRNDTIEQTNNNNLENDYENDYLLPKKISKITIENTADCSSEEKISGEGDNVKHFNDLDNTVHNLNHEYLKQDNSYDTYQYEPQEEIIHSNIEAEERTEVEQSHVEYNPQNENIYVEYNTNTTVPYTENLNVPSENYTSGLNYSKEYLKSQSLSTKTNDLGTVDNTLVSPVELIRTPEAGADTELEKTDTLKFEIIREATDDSEYPIDTINVKDFTTGDGVELHDDVNIISTKGDTEHYVDNISNQYDPQIQSIAEKHELEENIHSSDIQAFEAEQNQMFYSEEANETYDRYSENTNINNTAQNENNENYQYYEGAHQDQVYGHDVNEYDETLQTYDPNYEQRYVDPYEQSQDYVEPVQQYETVEHVQYTNDENYEIVQQNIESEPVIEKKLDDQGIHTEQNISEQLIGSAPSQT